MLQTNEMRPSVITLLVGSIASAATSVHSHGLTRALLPRANGGFCKLTASSGGEVRGVLHEGFGPTNSCAPSKGVLNAFMLFVDFADQPARGTGSDSTTALKTFFAPAADWYRTSSFNLLKFTVNVDTSKFYRLPANTSAYDSSRAPTAESHLKYIRDAVDAYLSGGGKAPSAPYDILYIVPTRNALGISTSLTTLIPIRSRSGVPFSRFGATTIGKNAYTYWQYKVINHETGHSMCLPDLYPEGGAVGQYVGGWDAMGYILATSPDYFAWNKWKLGWIDDNQVDCITDPGSTTHMVYPIEVKGVSGETKAVVVKRNNTMALVAEVRAKAGVDIAACATGVVLYTVQNADPRGKGYVRGPIRVIDTTPRSGGCDGEELSDGTLSLEKVKSFPVPGWNVTVTVTEKLGDAYRIKIDVS